MNLRKARARVRTLSQKGRREEGRKMERGKREKKEEEGRGGERTREEKRRQEERGRERGGEGRRRGGDKRTQVLGPPIHRHTSLGLAACSLGVWDRLLSEDALASSSTKQSR